MTLNPLGDRDEKDSSANIRPGDAPPEPCALRLLGKPAGRSWELWLRNKRAIPFRRQGRVPRHPDRPLFLRPWLAERDQASDQLQAVDHQGELLPKGWRSGEQQQPTLQL